MVIYDVLQDKTHDDALMYVKVYHNSSLSYWMNIEKVQCMLGYEFSISTMHRCFHFFQ
jgi:hypothetical protein